MFSNQVSNPAEFLSSKELLICEKSLLVWSDCARLEDVSCNADQTPSDDGIGGERTGEKTEHLFLKLEELVRKSNFTR